MEAKKDCQNKHKAISVDKTTGEKQAEMDNLGLDADHSSDTGYHHFNNDNDRITGNKDGEKDSDRDNGEVGHSPLMDK
ncbi:hypothetical protein AAKU52_001840 [Pedobacter sp. CG_S7]|uniref:hypothetical protein n=1 Tax=Pedobacter sp. CG_S7 TaxID=3143930 RepID=UPI003395EB21